MTTTSPALTPSRTAGWGPAGILDPSVLDGHLELLGSECVAGIIAKFLETAPDTARLVALAAQDGDVKVLGAQSHKLASGAVTLGLPALTECSRTVERLARSGETAAAVSAAAGIDAAMEEACAALRAVLANLPA